MISKEKVNDLQVSWKECETASALIVRGWLASLRLVRPETAGWLALAAHQRCYLTGFLASVDSAHATFCRLLKLRIL